MKKFFMSSQVNSLKVNVTQYQLCYINFEAISHLKKIVNLFFYSKYGMIEYIFYVILV